MICGEFSDNFYLQSKNLNPEPDTPIYLVLNCSEAVLQVVLGSPGQVLWSLNVLAPGRAMKHIAPAISSGLDCIGIKPEHLAGISCVKGPGSFTGIRMAFAHAHGLALASKIPMTSISYFDAIIHGPGSLLQGPAWIFIHSRRDQVYAMGFSLPSLRPVSAPCNIDFKSLDLLVKPVENQTVHVLGSGMRRNPHCFSADYWNILPENWDTPLPHSLLKLSVNSSFAVQTPFPEYLRPSDAEENMFLL